MNIRVQDGLPFVAVDLAHCGHRITIANVLLDTAGGWRNKTTATQPAQCKTGAGSDMAIETEMTPAAYSTLRKNSDWVT